jgi:hypothetical protein
VRIPLRAMMPDGPSKTGRPRDLFDLRIGSHQCVEGGIQTFDVPAG